MISAFYHLVSILSNNLAALCTYVLKLHIEMKPLVPRVLKIVFEFNSDSFVLKK